MPVCAYDPCLFSQFFGYPMERPPQQSLDHSRCLPGVRKISMVVTLATPINISFFHTMFPEQNINKQQLASPEPILRLLPSWLCCTLLYPFSYVSYASSYIVLFFIFFSLDESYSYVDGCELGLQGTRRWAFSVVSRASFASNYSLVTADIKSALGLA